MYKTFLPAAELKSYVRYFWTYEGNFTTGSGVQVTSFADVYPRFIYQDLNHYAPVVQESGHVLPQMYLSGLDTRPSTYSWANTFAHFGVSFYPHALPALLQVNPRELVNQLPDGLSILPALVADRLLLAKNTGEKIAALSNYFITRLSHFNSDQFMMRFIHQRQLSHHISLETIQKQHHITERQLERKFMHHLGITPKLYQRILRFECALLQLSGPQTISLTDLAYACGYYDQAHFIKDFKAFSGFTPNQFMHSHPLGGESSSFIYAR